MNVKAKKIIGENGRRILVALLVAMLSTTVVGCGKPKTEDDSPKTSEVVSELPSTTEASEPVFSEEPSEEVVSEEPSEETMDLTPYTVSNGKFPLDLVNDMNYNDFKVIVWRSGVGAKTILSDGDSYELQDEDDLLSLYFPNAMTDIQANEYVDIYGGNESASGFFIIGSGENMEVTFTGTDVDGKEYEITIYVTKDWKYGWE